jgi:MFS transporter, OFA family, oxalate/formate antiporter
VIDRGRSDAAVNKRRALLGAVLLDLAVSPLFSWDVFTESLEHDLGTASAPLTVVFSVGLLSFMGGVLIGGRMADRIAPRRLAIGTAIGTVLGLAASAVVGSVALMVIAFGVLVGASTGLGYATAVRVAGTVQSGRGLVLGLVVSAYAVGTAVLAPTSAALLESIGRTGTFLVLAAGLGVVLVVAVLLVPRQAPAPQSATRRDPGGRAGSTLPIVALWLAFGLGSAPALAAFAHAGQLAGSPGAVVVAVTLLNIGNFVGRLAAGPLSDLVGRRVALHVNSALLVLACSPLAVGAVEPVSLIALLLLGTQYGALSTLVPAATSDVVPTERFGATYGYVFTGWGAAGLLAPIAAATLAATAGFAVVYGLFLICGAVAWACAVAFNRLSRRAGSYPSDGR